MLSPDMILQAEKRIRPYIRETPLDKSLVLSKKHRVYLKLENLQHTGSFKLRGAMNKLLSLSDEARAGGVIAASTGNHGAAVAYGATALGSKSIIFVPENASKVKVAKMQRLGAEVRFAGDDGVVAENEARAFAEHEGLTYISPYNDWDVVAGQGTVGVEIARQLEPSSALSVLVALGGGGLISGIASYLKSVNPKTRIIACSPENSAVMIESLKAGKLLDFPSKPTLSDGTAGGVETGSITFELCQNLVDDYLTVSENEIKLALRTFLESHHMLIEGAAAVVLAAYERLKEQTTDTVLVLCGANISLSDLRKVI